MRDAVRCESLLKPLYNWIGCHALPILHAGLHDLLFIVIVTIHKLSGCLTVSWAWGKRREVKQN